MAVKTAQLAKSFLGELQSGSAKEAFDTLSELIVELENKIDPEPTDVRLVAQLYAFVEKLEVIKGNLGTYVTESMDNLPGNKLSTLWGNSSLDGTSKNLKL